MWNRPTAILVLAALTPTLMACNRLGNDPASWLMVIIPAAAAIAFYLQVLKDW